MNFEEFKNNVEIWAVGRGIYDHSTPEAQLLKALSELGELADAIIKDDREGLKDAIGDVAACWVNYCKMKKLQLDAPGEYAEKWNKDICPQNQVIANIARIISNNIHGNTEQGLNLVLSYLSAIANINNLKFMDCCESAWLEIKDRKGKMIAGGAFVKEEDLV